MAISGTVQLIGRLRFAPPASSTDGSANPTWISEIVEILACGAQESGTYTLTSDGDTPISLGALSGVGFNLVTVKVMPNVGIPPSPGFPLGVLASPNPVVVKLTGGAGGSQAITVDPYVFLQSSGVPYTSLTIARATGVQTTVRVQLFASGS